MEAKNTKGRLAAHEVLEKDGGNNEQVSPSNNKLIENNFGNSPDDDSNQPTGGTVVPGNPSDDSVQLQSGTPLESGTPPSDSYPTIPDTHTTATELSANSLSGTP